MRHPQTWSICIACISSVVLAIGLAVVSVPKSSVDTYKPQIVSAALNKEYQAVREHSDGVQKEKTPLTINQKILPALETSLKELPSPSLTMRHQGIDSAILSSSNSGENTDINHLLRQVKVDIANSHITLPKGNNAWEKLQLVLQRDAKNSEARDYLQRLMSAYIQLAKRAGNEGNTILHRHYLDQVHLVLFGTENTREQVAQDFASLSTAKN